MKQIPQMEPWFDEAETQAVTTYMQSGGWIMEFKKTAELEKVIADFTGASHCIMMPNGTISLTLALIALGIKTGDEVLVPDLTMIASPNAVVLAGAVPILMDIEPRTLCVNLDKAKEAITPRTKALMYVAFNGRSGDMAEAVNFCRVNNLFLIEDAAQAFGSYFGGKHLGTFGDAGSFSFSVPKIITTGQGGALVTTREDIAQKLRRLKDFGRAQGGIDIHEDWGWNFKFTDLQAIVGLEQMKKLPWRIARKKEIWRRYTDGLKDITQIELLPTNLNNTAPWFIDIFVDDADALQAYLKEKGVGTRRIYPAIHTQKIYADAYQGRSFPISEHYAVRGLWLPSSSKLSNEEIDYVVNAIKMYYHD